MKRALILAFLLLPGCAVHRWTYYMNSEVVRVAVIPPFNMTNEADQEDMLEVLGMIEEELKYRGYDVVPRETIMGFYQKNRFGIFEEIKMYTPEQLAKEFGAQAIHYSQVEFWGKRVMGVANYVGVEISFQMVDPSGKEIWKEVGKAGEESGGLDKRSILGSLVGTVLTDPGSFADDAVRQAYWKLGHAGYDPALQKSAPTDAPKPQ